MKRVFKGGMLLAAALAAALCLNVDSAQAARKTELAPRKLIVSEKKVNLYTGENKKLEIRAVKPEKASKKVRWKSKNPKVATVSKYGKLKAKKAGTTQVTATSVKNKKVTAKIKVVVKKHPKRVEKSCAFTGEFEKYQSILHQWGESKVIRTKEELKAAIVDCEDAEKQHWAGAAEMKNYLKKYEATDFRKKSVVLLEDLVFHTRIERIQSVETRLDSSGKLCCEVTLWCEGIEIPPGVYTIQMMEPVRIALVMDKKDVAMIDRYEVSHLFAEEEESHASLVDVEQTDKRVQVRVKFENKGTEELTYGKAFWVEKVGDPDWVKIEPQKDMAFTEEAYRLPAGKSAVETYILCSDEEEAPYKREDFEKGIYRIHVNGNLKKDKYNYVKFYIE